MSEFKVIGRIKSIGEKQEIGSNGFYKRSFVVETEENYPQVIQFESSKEKSDNLAKFNKVGDRVEVSFNLRGREWTNPEGVVKCFNSLDAWKVWSMTGDQNEEQVPDLPFD